MMADMGRSEGHGFGTAPVFLAAICTILGAVLYLRFGYGVAHTGVGGVLLIVLIGHCITIPTALAVSEIATNIKVEGGGEYFIISRTFGTTIGAAIGISLYVSQAVSVAFYMLAFAEAFRPLFPWVQEQIGVIPDVRMISLPATFFLIGLMLTKGADLGVKALWGVAVILGVSLVLFFLGTTPDSQPLSSIDFTAIVTDHDDFAVVFAIIFPAFTGMTAGVGLSGDLANPRKSIPLGTLAATLVGMVVYVLVALKLHLSAAPDALAANPLIMSDIALWGPIIPIGLGAAAISSALGSIMVAPRTLQALATDKVFPAGNGFLAQGKVGNNDPINATLVSGAIAVVFIALGDVDFVAQIISMFFMVTYGALCGISFLEHFAGNPSYRPSFRSKWYLSLAGSVLCFVMMFQMSVLYAILSLGVMFVIYLGVRSTQKNARGLASIFQGVSFQLTRWLQIFLQRNSMTFQEHSWRPSFIAISRHTTERLAPFELLKWFSYQQGFGTFIHYAEGYLSREKVEDTQRILSHMISQTEASGSGVFVDTMVSPSFVTALAQCIQMPGVSGLDNNSVLFEFDRDRMEEVEEIVKGCLLVGGLGFNTCVLRATEHHFGYKRRLHVWLTRHDDANANLMILLAYIILGHPDWKHAEISIFVTVPSDQLNEQVAGLNERIASGRLPISARNVRPLQADNDVALAERVAQHSGTADLVIVGFSLDLLEHKGADMFGTYDVPADVLFVNAQEEIVIS
ncbi:MAG: amino acid transporter [Candidatus Latescibacterota bacterium]|jgi:amino acid transporter